jgi:hypothetical protein
VKFNEVACEVCGRKADEGYAVYRTSPKPGPFRGACKDHFTGDAPMLVGITEAIARKSDKENPSQ